jgi:hypothetical protein
MGIKAKLKKVQELTKKYAKGKFLYPPIPIEKLIKQPKKLSTILILTKEKN